MTKTVLFLLLVTTVNRLQAQFVDCGPGRSPQKAFPLCGSSVTNQESVPNCPGRVMESVAKYCTDDVYNDANGIWYKFTANANAVLGFTITPKDLSFDYDWALIDVTGKDLEEAYTNSQLVVAFNYSGQPGVTGTDPNAVDLYACAGPSPTTCYEPDIIANHNYLLMINRFSNGGNTGYDLTITNGAAAIGFGEVPQMGNATVSCGGDLIGVKFPNVVKCGSIAADGSDFSISPALANVVSVTGYNCSTISNADSITLTLDKPLPEGTYSLLVKTGSDGNSLNNYCGTPLADGSSAAFTVAAGVKPSVSITSNVNNIRPNQPVRFTATATNAGSNPQFRWTLNGNPYGVTSAVFTAGGFSDGDVVQCTLLASEVGGCEAISNIITIRVVPLPVNLLYFTGTHSNGKNELQWQTAQEAKSSVFEVLRNRDANTFTSIGKKLAAGNSNTPLAYSFTDANFETGTNYYKLKMIDLDGAIKYSNVIALNNNIAANVSRIYPNPVVGNTLFAQIQSSSNQPTVLQVFDMQQRLLLQQSYTLRNGSNGISLNVSNLPAGSYILSIKGTDNKVLKFVKN